MGRIRVYPYKQGSRSAKALADALGGRVLKLEGSKFRYRDGDFIINWGNSVQYNGNTVNNSIATAWASNKLDSFRKLTEAGVRIPNFWTSIDEIPQDVRYPIVCRTILNGHSGRGIVMANSRDELVQAPLYVEYVPKTDEYRVHVVGDRAIAVQRKARRLDVRDDQVNWQVRNHANGFIFAREGFETPDDVIAQAVAAVAALGLDFGAVDIGFNLRRQEATVYEVNTAPGLEGQTVEDYANAFRALIE